MKVHVKWVVLLSISVLSGVGYGVSGPIPPAAAQNANEAAGDALLRKAFRERLSNLQVEGGGVVTQVLPDDQDGSRHQRFIVRLRSGQTLLIAHNIDLAPRVASLKERDSVSFHGEYEWNAKGGVIHWTHRDPAGRHEAGWVRHKDRIYQ
jgi:hypothetical protein